MSDILDKLRAFYENAETDECLYDIRRAIEELERLYALPVSDGPPTWQEEVASVEEAFERSGVKPTWPDDEPGNIGPMAAAMADEIERLRLADAEREAVGDGVRCCEYLAAHPPLESRADLAESAATLRGLLERCSPESDRPQPIAQLSGVGQAAIAGQCEVSVLPECATSPPWLARPFWVDPPSGWRYGFPRLYDPAKDGEMTAWMVANGYPQHLADKHLPCTFTAATDSELD